MQTIYFPDVPASRWHQPVVALGNFDGLHRGHMKIIDRVRRRAGERGGTPAAMTFEPHPSRVLRPDKAPPLLMTSDQKLEALGRAGMQGVAVVRFTRELSQWGPEQFVRAVLVEGSPARLMQIALEVSRWHGGPVVPVYHIDSVDPALLQYEMAISVNTAAAGGNASLMALGDGA